MVFVTEIVDQELAGDQEGAERATTISFVTCSA